MFRVLLAQRALVAMLIAMVVGVVGVHAYPVDRSNVYLQLIELRNPAAFLVLEYGYAALWFTTPLVLYVLWPRDKPPIHRALWITIALVALPSLFYQNSGWVQFGYLFSLNYFLFLIIVIAI